MSADEAEAAILRAIEGGPMCWADIAAACRDVPIRDLHLALRRLRRRGRVIATLDGLPARGASRIAGSGVAYSVTPEPAAPRTWRIRPAEPRDA